MIHLLDSLLTRHDLRTRMPFRYGIVTMTELPHVSLQVEAVIDGQTVRGVSADHLPPTWFTKDPDCDPRVEIEDMLSVIHQAMDAAAGIEAETLFAWWWQLFQEMDTWASARKIEPLLAHFGTSLVERAMIDAACRQAGRPFHEMLRQNTFGIDW